MGLYTGFDLHSSNSYVGVIDGDGRRLWKKKLRNDPSLISSTLKPFKEDIEGIIVESTFNWYWAVDLLMEEGYKVHLANPAKIQKYKGLKYADDEHDAFWLAEMLRLGILPEGYIYPKADRPIRDLLIVAGYRVRLANPSRIQQYSGLKHGDHEHDAFWLAEMLRLKILPEGYIYPKEQRPLRDLFRITDQNPHSSERAEFAEYMSYYTRKFLFLTNASA